MNSPDEAGAEELEAELRALGEALRVPEPPPSDVARAVRARLEGRERAGTAPPEARRPRRPGRTGRRRAWRWVAAGVTAVVALLAGLTPQGQAAVGAVLRFAGIEAHIGEEPRPLPGGAPSPLPGERRVTLEEARRAVRFPFAVPAALGEPRDVRVSDGGRVVSLLWPGVRLDAYEGVLTPLWRKDLGGPFPEEVVVGTAKGWWIGGPHQVTYLPADGTTRTLPRAAAPTLIWQRGEAGYRLEGPAELDRARRVAESLR
ncbi:hypothetical protein Skr01_70840 [Sphaerisporangium krabiense]|uniref:DUF4367 domain-containing protein n=1 Tax=Sphaerisporangium krabiense TaxID=763782 RepID=A0A7W8Z011_9ACTN|nr:hypothetical protein [Sphaerisporangium krabiense]MBB5624961.1 hypothetical protein [Sphaerisporangium krabiense]GII66999.1 hypothetical protein Skr01_70840 [Sphaerisporangium krabiense]